MIQLNAGDKAPDFELKDQDSNIIKLSKFKGKKVILYFYPKDDTPGCTKEACDLRDNISKLKKLNVEVIGVSNDDEISHKKFVEKYKLPFTLVCDTEKKVVKAYDVYKLKNFLGKSYYGIVRSTFLINEKGIIDKVFHKVNPLGHVSDILKFIKIG